MKLILVTMTAIFCLAAELVQAQAISYTKDIRPILNKRCLGCHGGVKRAAGLSFLNEQTLTKPTESGAVAVVPGKPADSEMLRRITAKDDNERMPPADHGPALSERETLLIGQWIQEGAKFEAHWAHRKPEATDPPPVADGQWPRSDLDRFILHRLELAGLRPSREADRRTWLRRATFDLTGLPPSLDDIHQFLADETPQAYEKVVDRLLNSQAYGERWASVWLDLARYADTVGFERDPTRAIWPWRDWVVNAYNADMPYDEFLTKQLAGDLLPNATLDDQLATGFHRNSQTNTEDGSDDEEFRNAALMDRMNTTWEGLMSTSFRCVQCHSHPYDPFEHKDFYRMLAVFNTTQDNDSSEDFPHLNVPVDPAKRGEADALDKEYQTTRTKLHEQGTQLSQRTDWKFLRATSAVSTGPTTMTIREVEGVPEITATGNVKLRGVFTLEFPLTAGHLTALRIEALPFDIERAATASELGFVLSHLKAEWFVPASTASQDGNAAANSPSAPVAVSLTAAFDEDPTAFYPAEGSLTEDLAGWSAYPRFNRARRVVFAVEKPVEVPVGAVLRLTMRQDAQSTGITAQVIRRARYAMSDDRCWCELVAAQSAERQKLAEIAGMRSKIASVAVPIMREQHVSQRRNSRLFLRGNFLTYGDPVEPGIPNVLGEAAVTNRLEFAKWMTNPNHPLTARSAVNRIWEQLFGRGLAEVVEDFGNAVPRPTHPELLDWLAVRYATQLKWSQKELLREMVLSATYRQEATVTQELKERDPQNRLYSRGPRTRLSAEMVRDQVLAVSGLLSRKMGGPPVMPLQPDGIWRTVYNSSKWETSPGEDAHRRSLYTFIRRTSGYPSYQIFDAPTREVCTARRITTNTPLQALVTLNDPVYIEAASSLAARMIKESNTIEDRIRYGYEAVTSEPIHDEAVLVLKKLHADNSARVDSEQKAWTIVANALLNLDASLTY